MTTDNDAAEVSAALSSVFLSYARKDDDEEQYGRPVTRLREELESRGYKVWQDTVELGTGEPWLEEIKDGIGECDFFVAFVGNHYLASPICGLEVWYANQLGKQIIPIFIQGPSFFNDFLDQSAIESKTRLARSPHDQGEFEKANIDADELVQRVVSILQRWNGITGCKHDDLDRMVSGLLAVFTTDPEYHRQHTRLTQKAREWDRNSRDSSYLLQDVALDEANNWLKYFWKKREIEPKADVTDADLLLAFISESNEARTNRIESQRRLFRRITYGLAMGIIVVTMLALFALNREVVARSESNQRATQEFIAREEAVARNNQFQTVALINSSVRIESLTDILHVTLYGQALWITTRDGYLHILRNDIGTELTEPLYIGEQPLRPIITGDGVWIASSRESAITRVNTETLTAVNPLTLPDRPNYVIDAFDSIWVLTERTLNRISGDQIETTRFNDDVSQLIATEEYLWTLSDEESALFRVDPQTMEQQTILLDKVPTNARYDSPLYAGGQLWIGEQTRSQLWRVDVATQDIGEPIPSTVSPVFDGDILWTADNGVVIGLNPQNAMERFRFVPGSNLIRRLVVDGQHLWIFTASSVQVRDLEQPGRITVNIPLRSTSTLADPVRTGDRYAWLSDRGNDTIYVIDLKTGRLVRQLTHCVAPDKPTFDGSMAWLRCDNGLVGVPFAAYYYREFGTEEVTSGPLRPHRPIQIEDTLWLIEQTSGLMYAFDTISGSSVVQTDLPIEVGAYPPLSLLDNQQFWTYGEPEGKPELLSINLRRDGTGVITERVDLPARISKLNWISGRIFATLVDLQVLSQDPPGIIIVDPSQLDSVVQRSFGQGLLDISRGEDNSLWGTSIDLINGYLHHFDAQTGESLTPDVRLPFTAWAPYQIGDTLWIAGAFSGGITIANSPDPRTREGVILRYSLQSDTLTEVIAFDDPITGFVAAGDYLFFNLTSGIPIVGSEDPSGNYALLAFDPASESIVQRWEPDCANLHTPYLDLDTELLWSICKDNGTVLVVDPYTLETVYQYTDDLLLSAWPPLRIHDYIWVVYRASASASIFDPNSGQLVCRVAVGNFPSAPGAGDNGSVWVMNLGDGTVQNIHVPHCIEQRS